MRSAYPSAAVDGYAHLIPQMTNHPGDRHVLAAAVHGGAAGVVTQNRRHFPKSACDPHGVTVWAPDSYMSELFAANPDAVIGCVTSMAAKRKRVVMTPTDVATRIARSLPRFAKTVLDSGRL
jgi:hypothetical protein